MISIAKIIRILAVVTFAFVAYWVWLEWSQPNIEALLKLQDKRLGKLSETYVGARESIPTLQNYKTTKLNVLEDIPPPILAKLHSHLSDRLGPEYGRMLQFSDGEVFDVADILRSYPSLEKAKADLPAFSIRYCVKIPNVHLCYRAGIDLRADGPVLQEINLPPLGAYPQRIQVKKNLDVLNSAEAHRLRQSEPLDRCGFAYSALAERFLYCFSQPIADNGVVKYFMYLYFDAATAEYWDFQLHVLFR